MFVYFFILSILVVINLQWQYMNQSVFKTIPTSIMSSNQLAMAVHEPVGVEGCILYDS